MREERRSDTWPDTAGSGPWSVWLQGKACRLVGTLWLNDIRGRTSSVFRYAPEWLESPDAFALGPDLPLGETSSCTGLFACFADCVPDRWGQTLLQQQENLLADQLKRTARTLRDADWLLRGCDLPRQGALRLSAEGGTTFLGSPGSCPAAGPVPGMPQLPQLLAAARRVQDKRGTLADLDLLVAAGACLGGARPKVSLLDEDGALCVAKLPATRDERDMPLWEYVTLRLARRAGLRTPPARLLQVAGEHVLLVCRFDRRFDRASEVRIPYLSGKSLLLARERERRSYVDLACALQEAGAPITDLQELWSRMVFNMCVFNVDDHLKNHGFLREESGWRLAPVFDLENSHPDESQPRLCTGIVQGLDGFDLQAALEAAEFFQLGTGEARERLDTIRKAVACWRQEAGLAGASPGETRRMRAAYEFL